MNLTGFTIPSCARMSACTDGVAVAVRATTGAASSLPLSPGRLAAGDTVIMLDLDHFKQVNDTLGHAAGDEVLRAFGRVLRSTVRARDTVGRFGGEEFLIILGPSGGAADVFLQRLQAEWLAERP